jgi:DNA-binding NarL/FixJ family response regulator
MHEAFDRSGLPVVDGAAPAVSDMALITPHPANHDKKQGGLVVLLIESRELIRSSLASALCAFSDDIDVISFWCAQHVTRRHSHVTACVLSVGSFGYADHRVVMDLSHLSLTLPSTPIIILADNARTAEVAGALTRGVRGYVQSDLELGLLVEAIRLVGRGGMSVLADSLSPVEEPEPRPGPNDRLARLISVSQPSVTEKAVLTPRETEILSRLQQGKLNKQIAHDLGISTWTVKAHVRSILRKTGATNRTQLGFLASSMRTFGLRGLPRNGDNQAATHKEYESKEPREEKPELFMCEADGI